MLWWYVDTRSDPSGLVPILQTLYRACYIVVNGLIRQQKSITAAAAATATSTPGIPTTSRERRRRHRQLNNHQRDRERVANSNTSDDESMRSHWRGRQSSKDDGESQNLLNLLYTIAEDQARKEGYIHRGITCNACHVSPLRGLRYKCANCADYDLCEQCEAQVLHDRAHVFLKLRIPIPPLANPQMVLLTPFYPGGKTFRKSSLISWDVVRRLEKRTHFTQPELEAFWDQYKVLSTVEGQDGGGINRDTFNLCLGPLGSSSNLVPERIFRFFDRDSDGVINFMEMVVGLSVLCRGTQEEKMRCAFRGYDLNDTGYLTRDDLSQIFRAYFFLSILLVKDALSTMEEEMMSSFDDRGIKPVSASFTTPIPRIAVTGIDNSEYRRPLKGSCGTISDDEKDSGVAAVAKTTANSDRTAYAGGEDMFPLMQALSQEAIDELVNTVFSNADLDHDDRLSWQEFQRWAAMDNTLSAWFESCGSVF